MLEINNKKIEVTKKLLEKECGITNFPVVFRLTNQLIKKQGKSSGKADQLNFGKSFSFPSWFNAQDDEKGTIEIRYFKTTKGFGDQKTYLPNEVTMGSRADITVPETDLDLIYFLALHIRNANSKYRDPSRKPWFFLEDLVKEAEIKANKKKLLNKIDTLLWNEEFGLSDDKLREVAKTYEISMVDKKSLDQIRVILDPLAKANPDEFLERTNNKKDMKLVAFLNDCVDHKIIGHKKVRNSHSWYILTDTGDTDEKICSIRKDEKPMEKLASYLLKTDETNIHGYLKSRLEEFKLSEDMMA